MSIHIAAKQGEIADKILLPGDPLRAKFIAENFMFSLQNYLNRILLDIQFMTQSMSGNVDASSALAKMPTITVRMAIAVIGIVPLIIVFPFFQKYFSKGITVGAVKG